MKSIRLLAAVPVAAFALAGAPGHAQSVSAGLAGVAHSHRGAVTGIHAAQIGSNAGLQFDIESYHAWCTTNVCQTYNNGGYRTLYNDPAAGDGYYADAEEYGPVTVQRTVGSNQFAGGPATDIYAECDHAYNVGASRYDDEIWASIRLPSSPYYGGSEFDGTIVGEGVVEGANISDTSTDATSQMRGRETPIIPQRVLRFQTASDNTKSSGNNVTGSMGGVQVTDNTYPTPTSPFTGPWGLLSGGIQIRLTGTIRTYLDYSPNEEESFVPQDSAIATHYGTMTCSTVRPQPNEASTVESDGNGEVYSAED